MSIKCFHIGAITPSNSSIVSALIDPANQSRVEYNPQDSIRETLRKRLRILYGLKSNGDYRPHVALEGRQSACAHRLNRGDNLIINPNGIIDIFDSSMTISNAQHTLKAQDMKSDQNKIEIIFDESEITKEEVELLQLLKGNKTDAFKIALAQQGKDVIKSQSEIDAYVRILEKKSSFVVVRGEVPQIYRLDQAVTLIPPLIIPIYYATFPKLTSGSELLKYYCPGGKLDDNKLDELKSIFMKILRLEREMAAKYQEAIDVVTPHAFLQGLSPTDMLAVKKLFYSAVATVAADDPQPAGFKGFYIHFLSTPREFNQERLDPTYEEIESIFKDVKPSKPIKAEVILTNGDALAPHTIAVEKHIHKVALTIMGEGAGLPGNGAWGARANQAMEENVTRMCPFLPLVFSSHFNPVLLDKARYQPAAKAIQQYEQSYTDTASAISGRMKNKF